MVIQVYAFWPFWAQWQYDSIPETKKSILKRKMPLNSLATKRRWGLRGMHGYFRRGLVGLEHQSCTVSYPDAWEDPKGRVPNSSLVDYGMVWYGMVWYGMVWYGMVWYGMVWYGMVWYGMVWYGMVWYGMVWYGMVWYGMVWYGMVWYGMVWYGKSMV